MKSSTKRILSVAFSFIFLIGTVVIYTNFILPQMKEVQDKRASVDTKETLFEDQKGKVEKVKNLITQSQGMGAIRDMVSLAIPENPQVTELIYQIDAIVNVSQVAITDFSIEPLILAKEKDPLVKQIGKIRVQMKLVGSYGSIKNFVQSIENNIRIASVETMDMQPVTSTGQSLQSLSMKAEFYYQQ